MVVTANEMQRGEWLSLVLYTYTHALIYPYYDAHCALAHPYAHAIRDVHTGRHESCLRIFVRARAHTHTPHAHSPRTHSILLTTVPPPSSHYHPLLHLHTHHDSGGPPLHHRIPGPPGMHPPMGMPSPRGIGPPMVPPPMNMVRLG